MESSPHFNHERKGCNRLSIRFDTCYEPEYAESSVQWLENLEPETSGMRKAKHFWLKCEKYFENPAAREEMRRCYAQDIETLRARVRERSICIRHETVLSKGYHRWPHAP